MFNGREDPGMHWGFKSKLAPLNPSVEWSHLSAGRKGRRWREETEQRSIFFLANDILFFSPSVLLPKNPLPSPTSISLCSQLM